MRLLRWQSFTGDATVYMCQWIRSSLVRLLFSSNIEECLAFYRICNNASALQHIPIYVQITKYSSPTACSVQDTWSGELSQSIFSWVRERILRVVCVNPATAQRRLKNFINFLAHWHEEWNWYRQIFMQVKCTLWFGNNHPVRSSCIIMKRLFFNTFLAWKYTFFRTKVCLYPADGT